jgi:hypothetical protein
MMSCAFVAGVCLVTPGRGRSVEEMFVATTQAAEDTEGAMCMMPDGVDGAESAQIAIPKSSNVEGGDLPPVRMVSSTPPTTW